MNKLTPAFDYDKYQPRLGLVELASDWQERISVNPELINQANEVISRHPDVSQLFEDGCWVSGSGVVDTIHLLGVTDEPERIDARMLMYQETVFEQHGKDPSDKLWLKCLDLQHIGGRALTCAGNVFVDPTKPIEAVSALGLDAIYYEDGSDTGISNTDSQRFELLHSSAESLSQYILSKQFIKANKITRARAIARRLKLAENDTDIVDCDTEFQADYVLVPSLESSGYDRESIKGKLVRGRILGLVVLHEQPIIDKGSAAIIPHAIADSVAVAVAERDDGEERIIHVPILRQAVKAVFKVIRNDYDDRSNNEPEELA